MPREPRLTWGGKVILTLSHAAVRYKLSVNGVRMAFKRAGLAPIEPPPIDERTPTFYQTAADKVMSHRPGTGHRRKS